MTEKHEKNMEHETIKMNPTVQAIIKQIPYDLIEASFIFLQCIKERFNIWQSFVYPPVPLLPPCTLMTPRLSAGRRSPTCDR